MYIFIYSEYDSECIPWISQYIGQLPRVSGEDPERIRVDSVFETSVCLFFSCLSANFLIICTIKYYSAVQYSMVTWPYCTVPYRTVGRTWSWPVMSAPACLGYQLFLPTKYEIINSFSSIFKELEWLHRSSLCDRLICSSQDSKL